jgi:hypothetical protein
VFSFVFLYLLEISIFLKNKEEEKLEGSTGYTQTISFLTILLILDVLFSILLDAKLVKETLLMTPALASYELVQFIFVIGAPDLGQFIFRYVIRAILLVIYRSILEPQLKNYTHSWKSVCRWLSDRHPYLKKLL